MQFRRFTVGQAVVRLVDDDTPARYRQALLSCETADVRYRLDGGEPDAQTGHLLYAEGTLVLDNGVEIVECQLFCPTGTAVMQLTLAEVQA